MAQQGEIHNLRLVSHSDLGGFGNIGEGVALQQASDGRRVLWLAHEGPPKDVTAVDVSDPANPRVIAQTELPHQQIRSNSLAVVDDLLLVAYQVSRPGSPTPAWACTTSPDPRRSGGSASSTPRGPAPGAPTASGASTGTMPT